LQILASNSPNPFANFSTEILEKRKKKKLLQSTEEKMSKAQGLIERKGSVCFFARTPGIRRICCGYCLLPIFLAFHFRYCEFCGNRGGCWKASGRDIYPFSQRSHELRNWFSFF
jgi:hypothetical protein